MNPGNDPSQNDSGIEPPSHLSSSARIGESIDDGHAGVLPTAPVANPLEDSAQTTVSSSPSVDPRLSQPGDPPSPETTSGYPNETGAGADPGGPPTSATPFFAEYASRFIPAPERIPNFGHLLIFLLLVIAGYICSGLVVLAALHAHLFGVTTLKQASNEIHYTLGSQVVWYFVSFGACALIFPALWHRSFLEGLGWHVDSAIRLRLRLIGAAVVCFVLAVIDGIFIPGPEDTPIDQMFRMPGAAWLLFAFGITLAPFFEETAFRGFLLPALCTACDWAREKITHTRPPPLDEDSHPQWSVTAMTVASLLTSLPFALMHGEQTGYSLGPFVLLMCVSLVLCWVRLATRSLASSVLVHSCYNLLLFSLMLAGTGGFKHLERM
jgi:membrane protease YdiL (CAAX protease family)